MAMKRLLPYTLVATTLFISSCGKSFELYDSTEGFQDNFEYKEDLLNDNNTSKENSQKNGENKSGEIEVNYETKKYEIAFVVGEQTIVKEFKYGETPVFGSQEPTLAPTETTSYKFKGWNPELKDVTDHAVYVAEFESEVRQYQVTYNYHNLTKTLYFSYGEQPYFAKRLNGKCEYKPITIVSDEQYKRSFVRWEPALSKVTCDIVYTAVYEETLQEYNITFEVDGINHTKTYKYGQMPDFGSVPTKVPDANNAYIFKGWNPEITTVTKKQKYVAEFVPTDRIQNITFVVDGKTEVKKYDWGEMPSYPTPTKAATAEYKYTFERWDPEITPVNGPATYTAVFSKEKQKYEIVFKLRGEEYKRDTYEYGSIPSFNFDSSRIKYIKPYKSSFIFSIDDNARYLFNGWIPNISLVSSNRVYNASLSLISSYATYRCWTDDISKIKDYKHRWYTLELDDGKQTVYQYSEADDVILESKEWKTGIISNKVLTVSNGTKSLSLTRASDSYDKYFYLD